jgi:hypothetical protein
LGAGFLLCVALKGSICLWGCAPLLWIVLEVQPKKERGKKLAG